MTPAVLALGDQDFGAGFIAFSIVVLLGIGLFFLLRSMNKHLRNVPDSFDPDAHQRTPAESLSDDPTTRPSGHG